MIESEALDIKAIREAKRAYHRNWRKNHPDNVRRAQERFWEKRAADMANIAPDRIGTEEHANNGGNG